MSRYISTVICVLAIGCGGAPEPAGEPASAPAPAETAAEPAAVTDGGADFVIDSAAIASEVLRIEGSGSLPDGALISYEVKHDGFDVGDYDGYETGQIEFRDGAFTFEMSVDDWPTGHALIQLTFEMQPSGDPQPPAVIEAYGANGETLTGPNVVEFGGRKTITVTGDAEIP